MYVYVIIACYMTRLRVYQGVLNLLGAGTVRKFGAGYCNTVVITGFPYCILLRWDRGWGSSSFGQCKF